MKKIIIILIILNIITILRGNDNMEYLIFDSETGSRLTLDELSEKLQNYDVIFFGELHDDVLIHKLEAEILPFLYEKNNNLLISLEMFERDVQPFLDRYLMGEISEKEFLANSRPWPNYKTDYRPIIEFAKEHNLPVLAANIPRRYAAMLNKQGYEKLKKLPESERKYFAEKLVVLDDEYKKRFFETMKSNMGIKGELPETKKNMLQNFYAAQCIKDDTMAESINEYLKNHSQTKVIHFNGDFHSNSHLGTAQKLALLNPSLKIGVIAPIIIPDNEELKFPKNAKKEGDFLIVQHRHSADDEEKTKMPQMFKK
ncbi:MAG: hypothetical protein B6D62_04175 [Candidatus Cloacimonas sp. 4484_275]|nr:MAG: hypothetical protein B6D62_04175 [Candidatus Cloacimonas sp. 4484_275]RLC51447.1 MAG: ABC transporter permease [Candidatus Cloacimonadota bacterium]